MSLAIKKIRKNRLFSLLRATICRPREERNNIKYLMNYTKGLYG